MEGKGNGIKTVVVNMVEIAKSLSRPPSCEITLFMYRCFYFYCLYYMKILASILAANWAPRLKWMPRTNATL